MSVLKDECSHTTKNVSLLFPDCCYIDFLPYGFFIGVAEGEPVGVGEGVIEPGVGELVVVAAGVFLVFDGGVFLVVGAGVFLVVGVVPGLAVPVGVGVAVGVGVVPVVCAWTIDGKVTTGVAIAILKTRETAMDLRNLLILTGHSS